MTAGAFSRQTPALAASVHARGIDAEDEKAIWWWIFTIPHNDMTSLVADSLPPITRRACRRIIRAGTRLFFFFCFLFMQDCLLCAYQLAKLASVSGKLTWMIANMHHF